MSYSRYGDEAGIDQHTTNLFPILNKMDTMESIASFVQVHPKSVTKYANQIADKIRSLKSQGYVHLNMIRTLINEMIGHRDAFNYDEDVDYGNAVYTVLAAYSEWLLPAYRPGTSYVLCDDNGNYNTSHKYTDEVARRFEKTYLVAILLCANAATADAFIAKYPSVREDLFDFMIDDNYFDQKPECKNLIKEFLLKNFPTMTYFSSIDKGYFAARNLKIKLINEMEISDSEKMDLQRLPLEDIIAALCRAFGFGYADGESNWRTFAYAETQYKHFERLDEISKYERYYGDDAGLLFNEAISIFYQWFWERTRFGDWISRTVIEERKFIDYISEEYKVDSSIGKLFVIRALEWVDSRDASKDEILRVQTLIKSGENVKLNLNSEPVEPTFYQWKKDKSDFEEMASIEEDDYIYEEATEAASRRKTNIRRTAKIERGKSKLYGMAKDVNDSVEKFNSQATGLLDSMKKMFVGDVRSEVIEGKHVTFMTLFKKLIGLAIASQLGVVKGACMLLVRYVMKKKMTAREKNQVIHELETEIAIITEKIQDADRDGNKKAKYNMMRTKAELERAKYRIQAGLGNVAKKSATVKASLSEGGY